jgi:magnesium-transporting ATPase (P-type)
MPYVTEYFSRDGSAGNIPFLTAFFSLFVFMNNFNKFNVRVSDNRLLHHIDQNKGFSRVVALIFFIQIIIVLIGGQMFRTTPLNWREWAFVLLVSFLIVPFDLFRKRLRGQIKL